LYVRTDKEGLNSAILVYVDDVIIVAKGKEEMEKIKYEMHSRFKMEDMGELSWFLSVLYERNRDKRTIKMSQTAYIDKLLVKYKMDDANAVSTPMVPDAVDLMSVESKELKELTRGTPNEWLTWYRSLVGALLYLATWTRPDISYAVGILTRSMNYSNEIHRTAAKRVLRYLKGTRNYGIEYRDEDWPLTGFSDSDFASDKGDRKSISGSVFFLGGGVISWRSKKQDVTALSTCEAEYIAAALACKEAIWLSRLESFIRGREQQSVRLMMDNQSAIKLASTTKNHERSKHIAVKYHFIREKVESDEINLRYVETQLMVADVFTKALGRQKFEYFRERMCIKGNTSEMTLGLSGSTSTSSGSVKSGLEG